MKNLTRPIKPLVSLLAITAICGAMTARAQSVDANFYSALFGGSAASGAGVVGAAGDVWNGINGDDGLAAGPFSLVNTAGGATSLTLSYGLTNNTDLIGAITSLAQNTQQNPSLMNNYLFDNVGDEITVTIAGLADNTPYDLYLYLASNDGNSSARAADVVANSVSGMVTGDSEPAFTPGQDYILLQPISSATGTISITESDGIANSSGEVDMNGLQLRSVPDATATLSLLALSMAGLALIGRKNLQPRLES